MSEPNDPFEMLRGGLDVTPPPASEIRRRGDRRRRRTTTLAPAGAAVAAILAIAIPFTFVARHDGTNVPVVTNATTPSSPTTTAATAPNPTAIATGSLQRNDNGWVVAVPAGFPLADGIGASGSGTPVIGIGPGHSPSVLCKGVVIVRPQDTAVAAAHVTSTDAGDYGEGRALYLYPADSTAHVTVRSSRERAQHCARTSNDLTTAFMLDAGTASHETRVAFGYVTSTGEQGVYLILNVGNAILVENAVSAGGSVVASKADLQQMADTLVSESQGVVSAMDLFAEPVASSSAVGPTGTLGPDGYGSLKLGMSYADALATGQLAKSSAAMSGWMIKGHPKSGVCLSKANGLMAIFGDPTMATPEGIHLGSTMAEVRAAYPKLKRAIDGYYVMLTPTTKYQFLIQQRSTVYEWDLTTTNETCFG